MNKPEGTVTFLFTDIEGSTRLAQEFPETLQASLNKHHSIMQEAIESNNGFVFEIIGDAFCAAFENASDAVNAAIDAQLKLENENRLSSDNEKDKIIIKVRMGIHSGNVEWNGKTYMGYITLARTARTMSVAYGEQILISEDVYRLCKNNFAVTADASPEITGRTSHQISFRDLGERRLKDVIQPIRLYQIIAPGLREDFPHLKTLDARPNNLPVQLTSFIGREESIKQIKDMLKQTSLLTLTGPGGTGKTRLALQTAADIIDEFANGVWFVDLASLAEAEFLPDTIVNSLGIAEQPNQKVEKTLIDFLKEKQLLIILDNCEHLIHECSVLAEKLLQGAANLKIIATSREALKCSGEIIHQLSPLNVPDPKNNNSPEQLLQYESVRLFIERALVVNAGFRVNENNAGALAGICHALDGIPLAIELAAARAKILPLDKIYERLSDRFRLLTGGKRTALPRQQTLKAMIDWSYELLTDSEKNVWNKLSIFSGGWELEAAESICSDEKISHTDIIELHQSLNEKSIISYDQNNERYTMLETIRQYGRENLESGNEFEKISDNHLEYYLDFAKMADTYLTGPEITLWLNKLEIEKGNMDTALLRAENRKDISKGLMLTAYLGYFWNVRGHYSEGKRWLESFTGAFGNSDNYYMAKSLNYYGRLLHLQGENEISLKYLERSLEIMRKINAKSGIASTLNSLGLYYFEVGELAKASQAYEESQNVLTEIGDDKAIGYCKNDLGMLSLEKGEYGIASELFNESVKIHRKSGDKRGLAYALRNLGNVTIQQDDFVNGVEIYNECIEIFSELDDKRGRAFSLCALGNLQYKLGNFVSASSQLEEGLTIFRDIAEKRGTAYALSSLANVTVTMGEYERTFKLLEESLIINRESKNKSMIAYTLFNFGSAKLVQGELAEAEKFFEESLDISRQLGHKPGIAYNLNGLGFISNKKKKYDEAYKIFKESLILNKELNQTKEFTLNILGLAEINYAKNKFIQAAVLLGFYRGFQESTRIVIDKLEDTRVNELEKLLNEKLSIEEFQKYSEKGKKLTLNEVAEDL